MTFSEVIGSVLIGPIKVLFELVFMIGYDLTQSPGAAIVFLSLVMNLMLLPLYSRTDKIQLEAMEKEMKMGPVVKHIKKTFRGNEQYMMLQTYYRQCHYTPLDSLKGLSPLLLEIPFFMAAYSFLSGLFLLNGASFGNIMDLGAPDELLFIRGRLINLLPILMTLINFLAGRLYTKNAPVRVKLPLYGMAVLFLIVLYDSPAGLVLYWTLNNAFSLGKTLVQKTRDPAKTARHLSSVMGLLILTGFLFLSPAALPCRLGWGLLACSLLQIPGACFLLKKKKGMHFRSLSENTDKSLFFLTCICLMLLIGVLIPSAVIRSSPAEFMDRSMHTPLRNMEYTCLVSAGAFLFWGPVFFFLTDSRGRHGMSGLAWLLMVISLTNYMLFGGDYGMLSPTLKYLQRPVFDKVLVNGLFLVGIGAAALYFFQKKPKGISVFCRVMSLSLVIMSLINIGGIHKDYQDTVEILRSGKNQQEESMISLNQHGKNVVIIMLDRAINSYIPYIMEEKPEIKQQFEGFTYYPNTASFGPCTNIGLPPLVGGYEYTPQQMNLRKEEKLVDKHNEALKVMPVLFLQNGFQVAVGDPSYAGYHWISDLSIYEDYPEIRAFHSYDYIDSTAKMRHDLEMTGRQFLFYSLFRTAPVILQPYLYDDGDYHFMEHMAQGKKISGQGQKITDYYHAQGQSETFLNAYTVLRRLPELTQIQDSGQNTFLFMTNDTTHEPCLLQEPEYAPQEHVDNWEYEQANDHTRISELGRLQFTEESHYTHYEVNMAAMLQLGQWFDYLREKGVYDNTRIILVSDHGGDIAQDYRLIWGREYYQDAMQNNPLLMIKDFDSHTFSTDPSFMTNGDVPALAAEDLIQDPQNPFTGNPIHMEPKSQPIHILFSDWKVSKNNGNTFLPGPWVSVQEDIWNKDNWKVLRTE